MAKAIQWANQNDTASSWQIVFSGRASIFSPLTDNNSKITQKHLFYFFKGTAKTSAKDLLRLHNTTSFAEPFPWLGGGREKVLASAGHMSIVHPVVMGVINRLHSINQYSSMAPRLSGQNCKFFKFLLSLNSQGTWIQRKQHQIYSYFN